MTLRLCQTRFTDLAQMLHACLVRGSNHEIDILRLKSILHGKFRLMAIWNPSRTWKRG